MAASGLTCNSSEGQIHLLCVLHVQTDRNRHMCRPRSQRNLTHLAGLQSSRLQQHYHIQAQISTVLQVILNMRVLCRNVGRTVALERLPANQPHQPVSSMMSVGIGIEFCPSSVKPNGTPHEQQLWLSLFPQFSDLVSPSSNRYLLHVSTSSNIECEESKQYNSKFRLRSKLTPASAMRLQVKAGVQIVLVPLLTPPTIDPTRPFGAHPTQEARK